MASEYVRQLQALIDAHGDHECLDVHDHPMPAPTYSAAPGIEPAFILAARAGS